MAKLSEKQKKAVPKSQRGIPSKSGTGSYPMPDKAHAANAKARAAQFASPAQQKKIDAKANKILGKKKGK
jgi:hypothetical protein